MACLKCSLSRLISALSHSPSLLLSVRWWLHWCASEERGLSVAILRRIYPWLHTLSSSVYAEGLSWIYRLKGQCLSMYIRHNVTHNHDFQTLFVIIRRVWQEPFSAADIAKNLKQISRAWGMSATPREQRRGQQQDKASIVVWGMKRQFIIH